MHIQIIPFIFGFFILSQTAFGLSSRTEALFHVVIDPGHGGQDAGAVYGQAKEADIALQVSLELKEIIQKDSSFKVSLTRESDTSLSLDERVQKAENEKADIFLSLHANAIQNQKIKGIEFYFQNHLAADEETLYLANLENQLSNEVLKNKSSLSSDQDLTKKSDVLAIIEDLKRNTKIKHSHLLSQNLLQAWSRKSNRTPKSIKQAPFYVISRTKIPSVLVELGFLSNPNEAAKLQQKAYQRHLAENIFAGIKDFKENVDNRELRSLQ